MPRTERSQTINTRPPLQRFVDALLRPEIGLIESTFSDLLPKALEINRMTNLANFPPNLELEGQERELYFKERDRELTRQGGYAALYKEGMTRKPIVFKVGGVSTEEKDAKYQAYAEEKLEALRRHAEARVSGHTGEMIGNDPMPDGAIRTKNGWIISFSGFQPDLDELFCLAVANTAGVINTQETNEIAIISGNKIFGDYFKYFIN
jgi:hypothetical protein